MPIISKDLRTLHRELAVALGDLVGEGTVTAATVSQIQTKDLIHQRVDQLRGHHIYLHTGGGSPQDRVITAFTPYSVAGQQATVQVLQQFNPVPSTNTQFFVHRLFSGTQYNEAIIQAVRRVVRRQLTDKVDTSLVLDSRLENAAFQLWSGGTSAAPDGWTLVGTGASVVQETGLVYPGTLYSAKLTNGASQEAYLSQSIADYANFAGESFNLKVTVYTSTAGRVRVRVTDGVNTWNSDYHDGQGAKTLEITGQTLAANLTALTVQLRIETGSSISAYWQKALLDVGGHRYSYPLSTWPTGFVYVDTVRMEGVQDGVFDVVVPDEWWYIDRANKSLVFLPQWFVPSAGKLLQIQGQAYPAEPATETDKVEVDSEYVLRQAGVYLLTSLPWGTVDSEGLRERYVAWRQEAERLEAQARVRPRLNAKVVEAL